MNCNRYRLAAAVVRLAGRPKDVMECREFYIMACHEKMKRKIYKDFRKINLIIINLLRLGKFIAFDTDVIF